MRTAQPLRQRVSQDEVARLICVPWKPCSRVHRQPVSRWAKHLVERGQASLKKARRAGWKPCLRPANVRRIQDEVMHAPEAQRNINGLWTAQSEGALTQHDCGVQYHPNYVYRILHQVGWSIERPIGRGVEPAMSRRCGAGKRNGGQFQKRCTSREKHGLLNGSGLSERLQQVRIWAPRGQTRFSPGQHPGSQDHFNWKTLSAIAL